MESYSKKDTMEVAGICAKILENEKPDMMFIDVGGLGAGVVDRLVEMGFEQRITAVNGGEKPLDGEKYSNKRAEMRGSLKEWLDDGPIQLPDSDTLHADLIAPTYSYDSNTRLKLERKEGHEIAVAPPPPHGASAMDAGPGPPLRQAGCRDVEEGHRHPPTFLYCNGSVGPVWGGGF